MSTTALPLISVAGQAARWLAPDEAKLGAQTPTGHGGSSGQPQPSTARHTNTLAEMARDSGAALARLAGAGRGGEAAAAPAKTSELNLDEQGLVHHDKVQNGIHANRHIERGDMSQVNGIVIHQTGASTAASTFSSYAKPGANGAHFLIDKDGTIYQTASLRKVTNHVGKLRSRCEAEQSCPESKSSVKDMHDRETAKNAGERYPSNQDAIGIELVGGYHKARSLTESADTRGQRTVTLQTDKGRTIVYERVSDDTWGAMQYEYRKTDDKHIYEPVTEAQNEALKWLTAQLQTEFQVPDSEVFAHPVVSYKNMTEASMAQPR